MKKSLILLLFCLAILICSAGFAVGTEKHIFLSNDVPQLQIELNTSWKTVGVERAKNEFLGFSPLQEYAHSDGIHKLIVYFIPYNTAFTPPATLSIVQDALSAQGIETQIDELNGAGILKGMLLPAENGYGMIVQDTLQYGYYAIIGMPYQKNDAELDQVFKSLRDAEHLGDAALSEKKADAPAEQPGASANLQEKAEELKAQRGEIEKKISKLEKELKALQASYAEAEAAVTDLEKELKQLGKDAEALSEQLGAVKKELEAFSAYLKCGNCGYGFSWEAAFRFCPVCGTARTIPQGSQENLTEEYYAGLLSKETALQKQYDEIVSSSKEKKDALGKLKDSLSALEKQIRKAYDDLESAKKEYAEIETQLEALLKQIEEAENQGKCPKCGYVFPENSSFKYCPICGTTR